MRVAAVQFKAERGDPSRALTRLVPLALRAARGAELVVLPELAATGYVYPSLSAIRRVAEPARGPTLAALSPVAREAGAWLVCGFPEEAGQRVYNSALVIDPRGDLRFVYRKTLLFEADLPWATPGDSGYRAFDTGRGTFAVGICMDLNDDRLLLWCRLARVDVLAMPTAWVDEPRSVWPYWARRARAAGVALVAADTWGAEDDRRFAGVSAVVEDGLVRAGCSDRGDGLALADVRLGGHPAT